MDRFDLPHKNLQKFCKRSGTGESQCIFIAQNKNSTCTTFVYQVYLHKVPAHLVFDEPSISNKYGIIRSLKLDFVHFCLFKIVCVCFKQFLLH